MRVLVCGGRQYADIATIYRELNKIHEVTPITCLIEGGAKGADAIGYMWALSTGVPTERYNADWKIYGKRAGPIRNQEMIDKGHPDICLAFPSPDSIGTHDMISRALAAKIEVRKL